MGLAFDAAGAEQRDMALDVTEPAAPRLLSHIPGEPSGGAQMARVCGGAVLPRGDKSKTYLLRSYGHSAHEVWDVSAPARPSKVATVSDGLRGTHKSWWECDTGIAYLVSGVPGWRTHRMTQVFDLSDPSRPRFIRNYGLAGQQPGSPGRVPTGLHGMISAGPARNRVYFGHGTSHDGILQIVDREKLLKGPPEPSEANLLHPQAGRLDLPATIGAHTTLPLLGMQVDGKPRDYVLIVNESLADACREPRQMVWIADVTDEAKPVLVSRWTVPEGDFCSRGGRFGAHSSNESAAPLYHRRVVFVAWFNAGVRALDVRDPRAPREIGYYIPDSLGRAPIQTNNVEVDERGYIYIVDRHGAGMHILALTGEARRSLDLPSRDAR